jgi:uncharacterized protein (TIGR03437 family)
MGMMITLTNGTTIVPTTHHIAGVQVITATSGPLDMTISGSANVTITPAAATDFAVGAPASASAGAAFTFTVTAQDQFNNTATGYPGTVHFTSSDGNASLPANATLSNGVGSFSATLKTAGSQTITGTDTNTSSITGTSNTIVVSAATLDHFLVTAPASTTVGTSFNVTAVAIDAHGNTITSYNGPATVTSSDGQAVLPPTLTMFMSGTASFAATLNTRGNQSITVTDTVGTMKTGTAQITVNSAAATKILITATPVTVTAGTQFMFTATAEDSFGNVVQNYTGTLHFTSSDPNAVNPPDSTLTNGTGTFTATLETAGSQTLTATDTANAMITGTSNGIVVTPGPLTHFQIVVPGTVTAGQQFQVIIAAKDQFNNTVASYTGPVTITSTDPQLQIIQPPSFVNGLSTTGQVMLKTAGEQTLTLTDPTTMVSTTSSVIQVLPGPPGSIQIVSGNSSGPAPNNGPVAINTAFPNPLVVSVSDKYGNLIPGQAVTFSAPDTGASAVLSGSTVPTGSDGQASLMATANQVAGAYAVTATINSNSQPPPTTPQVQFSLTNLPGPAATIQATSGTPQSADVGTQFAMSLVVTVTDSAGNGVPGVSVTFSIPAQSGPSATLTPAGLYTTNAAGKVTVTATANGLVGIYNVAASISVNGATQSASFLLENTAGIPGTLTITGSPQSTTVNSQFPTALSVFAKDVSGNPVSGATVVFVIPATGPSANLSEEMAVTDASGMASVTAAANAIAGNYTVAVGASSGGTGTFTLTNTAGAAVAIEVVPGATPQSAQTNSFFSQPLKVQVTDASGNGVPNVSVVFQTPQTGASATLSAALANTDAQGFASVTALANGFAGGYFVSATAAGVPAAAPFSLQNLAQPPDRIIVSGGGSQSAVVSQQFSQTLQVTVFDAQSNPLPNVTVTFAPPATGASATLSALSGVTNAQGQASVIATANTVAGTYQVVAAAEGISTSTTAIFNLTNLAGAAASITADLSGTPQSARVNTAFLAPLLVNVTDAHGNPIGGVAVSYSAPGSGPSALLSAAANVTNAQGQTSVTAVANAVAGSYTVTASLAGGGSATFNLTNTSGPPASIKIISGNQQTMTVGGTFAPLVVAVLDAFGNRVPGQTVTFASPSSGASAAAASGVLTTDSSGQASFNVTANTIAGRYTVAISGAGIAAPVVFALTNTAAAAARILVVSGSPQTSVSGTPFAPLQVLVEDDFGNPVSGATVSFSAPSSGATALLSAASTITDFAGQASIGAIAGSAAGSYAVTASAAGVTGSALFSLTNAASFSGTIISTGGTTQSTPLLTAFALPLAAKVVDPAGNPVPGVTVTFTVPSSGPSATLSSNGPVTNSQGNVSIIATASNLAGSYQVTASAAGFSGKAVFNLQNTPVTPGQPTINAIVNAASFIGGASPRSLQTIFGSNLATTTAMATTVPLPTTLGGVTVTIGSTQVPLLYVSPTQINFQAPTALSTGPVVVTVSPSPTSAASGPLLVGPVAPGNFLQINSDITRAAAVNTDGRINSPSTPAPAGGYIQMFLTGIGAVSPQIPTGQAAPLTPLSNAQGSVSATIGSRVATVQFAGAAPLMVGDQVNLQIPIDLPPGVYPVVISVNGVPSNAAVISVGPAHGN